MSNEILNFCETDNGTNLLTQAEYLADAQRLIGNAPGVARLKLVNKAIRQSSFISKNFADYLIQQVGGDVLDDGDDAALLAKITSCFATGVPIGAIFDMSAPQVPSGFLKCNGAAISRTTYAPLFAALVTAQSFTPVNFTVTVASPAVVTSTAHGLQNGARLRLSTTGTLPTGLNTSTDYFVWRIDANTFRLQTLADVLAGTFVNTSATQSGTHSYLQSLWGLGDGSTTFNLPDLRGVFKRAWDDSRGIDPSRTIATLQMGATAPNGLGVNVAVATFNNSLNAVWWSHASRVSAGISNIPTYATAGNYTGSNTFTGDTETRPINVALMPVIKY